MQASPSKARAQAIESHSWSMVQSWLSDVYHPSPVPTFERNATTLKALQGLMTESIAADRTRKLLSEAQREEIETAASGTQSRKKTTTTGSDTNSESVLHSLEISISASSKTALESLASSALLLGCCPNSTSQILHDLQSQIVLLTQQTFALEGQLSSIETLTSTLRRQINETRQSLSELSFQAPTPGSPAQSPPSPSSSSSPANDFSALHGSTLHHQRETKQLLLKSSEYRNRITTLERRLHEQEQQHQQEQHQPLLSTQLSVARKRTRLADLEAKIRAFSGLPPDVETSRAEVRRAQAQLANLRSERDALFESMLSASA